VVLSNASSGKEFAVDLKKAFASVLVLASWGAIVGVAFGADETHTVPPPSPVVVTSAMPRLPEAAQASISAALGRDHRAYHVVAQPRGFRADNERHGLSAEFTSSGADFKAEGKHFGLALTGYGYGADLQAVPMTAPDAIGNRVEYRRGSLTEWYVNGPLGLEQGFTVARRPGQSHGRPLTLVLALSGT
jgi:trimeric autotransporter adhesin